LFSYALAVYPEVQEELSDIIASEVNGEVNYENLKKIKFLDAIIKETQRFYPTNPFLSRECDETTTINGIPIEKVLFYKIWVPFTPRF
jgi:cytochrome P450